MKRKFNFCTESMQFWMHKQTYQNIAVSADTWIPLVLVGSEMVAPEESLATRQPPVPAVEPGQAPVSHRGAITLAIAGFTFWVLCDSTIKLAGRSHLPSYEITACLGTSMALCISRT